MRAIAEKSRSQTVLPALKETPSDFAKLVQEIKDRVWEMLHNIFGERQSNVNTGEIFRWFLIACGVLAILLTVCAIVQAVRRRGENQPHWQSRPRAVAPAARDEVADALAAGDRKAALRARWRRYLHAKGLPESRTPRETIPNAQATLNAAMFAPAQLSGEEYESAARLFEGGAP